MSSSEGHSGQDGLSEKDHLENLFTNLVEFIYTGDIGVEQDCPRDLLYLMILAESFQVLDLKKRYPN